MLLIVKEEIVYFVDENIDLEKLGKSVGKLYEKASKNNIKRSKLHGIIFP